jgi:hypothetical protein
LLVTYGWCVLIPSEEGIEISNMDNVYLYADNDRVTDIFTTYNVSHLYLDGKYSERLGLGYF